MSLFNAIEAKINKELSPENIKIIDNSGLHTKHKSFDSSKYHLKIIISSKKLKEMDRLKAHKLIFSILKNEMKYKIHALEIEIK